MNETIRGLLEQLEDAKNVVLNIYSDCVEALSKVPEDEDNVDTYDTVDSARDEIDDARISLEGAIESLKGLV